MKDFLPILLFFFCSAFTVHGQDDLLSLVEDEDEEVNYAYAAFKTTRVVNGHSIENTAGGVLDVKISHRFGFINSGIQDLFGLDNATIRLGADYGISDRLMIGVGRSSFEKVYDGFLKFKVLRQSTGAKRMPVSVSYLTSAAVTTIDFEDEGRENFNSSRWFFTHQLLLARKFSEGFTFQLMPTLVHRNLVESTQVKNDVFSLGAAFRQKITKRLTINAEYFYVLPDQIADTFRNSFSIGFDIETGGHVFQLHFTNSTAMIEKGFIAETVGDWADGDIHFGFNIARVFTIKKPKFD